MLTQRQSVYRLTGVVKLQPKVRWNAGTVGTLDRQSQVTCGRLVLKVVKRIVGYRVVQGLTRRGSHPPYVVKKYRGEVRRQGGWYG